LEYYSSSTILFWLSNDIGWILFMNGSGMEGDSDDK
jgi:hypothetical protein